MIERLIELFCLDKKSKMKNKKVRNIDILYKEITRNPEDNKGGRE